MKLCIKFQHRPSYMEDIPKHFSLFFPDTLYLGRNETAKF